MDRILLPVILEGRDADGGAAAEDRLRTEQHNNRASSITRDKASLMAKVTSTARTKASRNIRAGVVLARSTRDASRADVPVK